MNNDPFILVTTNTIDRGQLERVQELSVRFAERVQAGDTGLLAYTFYVNEDGTEVSNGQVHRDAASMETYLPLAQGLIEQALSVTKTRTIDVYGAPGPIAQQVLRNNAEQGATVRGLPTRAGFGRASAA